MPLCTVDDTLRYLREEFPKDPQNDLPPFIEEATDYVQRITGLNFLAAPGSTNTASFFMVREEALIALPDRAPQITQVLCWYKEELPTRQLGLDDYIVQNEGIIRLKPYIWDWDWDVYSVGRMGFLTQRRYKLWLDKVEVTFRASGSVPYSVREAGALIAAACWKQAPMDASALTSERLGGYSYVRSPHDPAAVVVPQKARVMLRLYSRRGKMRST